MSRLISLQLPRVIIFGGKWNLFFAFTSSSSLRYPYNWQQHVHIWSTSCISFKLIFSRSMVCGELARVNQLSALVHSCFHRFIERFMHLHIHALEMIISFPPLPPDVCRNTHSFYMPFNLLARILYWIYSVARGDNKISISCQRTLQLTMSYNRWTRHHFLCRTRSLTSDGNESLEFLRISYRSPVSSGWNAIEKKRFLMRFNFPPTRRDWVFPKGEG